MKTVFQEHFPAGSLHIIHFPKEIACTHGYSQYEKAANKLREA
jgi:hypothetical protein